MRYNDARKIVDQITEMWDRGDSRDEMTMFLVAVMDERELAQDAAYAKVESELDAALGEYNDRVYQPTKLSPDDWAWYWIPFRALGRGLWWLAFGSARFDQEKADRADRKGSGSVG